MKKIILLFSVFTFTQKSDGQTQLLCDFETTKQVYFNYYDGTLDTLSTNPSTAGSNTSAVCAKYIRDTILFDNIQMRTFTKFDDISYLASTSASSKMSMMVWSNMPVGTRVEIQLGTSTDLNYPSGIHSVYAATTSVMHSWETLTFNFSSVPGPPSFSLSGSIDKMVILFHPNSNSKDTIYFDNPMGPTIVAATGLTERSTENFKVFQNKPNPARDNTSIKLQLGQSGLVNVTLYDILGKAISTVVNEEMTPGTHTVNITTENLPNGIYFYEIKQGNNSQSMKMIVAK
jgi:hypothetical protein